MWIGQKQIRGANNIKDSRLWIRDCLDNGIIPIIAYQADAFKNDPSDKNIENVVTWWSEVAEHYQDKSLIPSPATIK